MADRQQELHTQVKEVSTAYQAACVEYLAVESLYYKTIRKQEEKNYNEDIARIARRNNHAFDACSRLRKKLDDVQQILVLNQNDPHNHQ